MGDAGNLILVSSIGALILALVHFSLLLWKVPLKRPQAYAIGVGILLGAFWLWSWLDGDLRPAVAVACE
jgi:hypothetical protein